MQPLKIKLNTPNNSKIIQDIVFHIDLFVEHCFDEKKYLYIVLCTVI